MKSKIFSLSIATLILWGSTTEPMGRFFRYKSPAVAKWANRAQWATMAIGAASQLDATKKSFKNAEEYYDSLPDMDTFKEAYLSHRQNNPDGKKTMPDGSVVITRNGPAIPESDLDKMNTSYVRNLIHDDSVQVKFDPRKDEAGGLNECFSGKKYIILPANARTPDGVIHHEYAHIVDNHIIKRNMLVAFGPLAMLGIFKTTLYGYKIMRYGYIAAKNHIPSIGVSLLKIPGTLLTYMATAFPAHYQSRLQEQEADDAIPAPLAKEVANYFKLDIESIGYEERRSSPLKFRLLAEHFPIEDRIERLEARAVQAKA